MSSTKASTHFAKSCLTSALSVTSQTTNILAWLKGLKANPTFRVTPIPFSQLEHWSFEESTGDLVHRTGKFFRVLGVRQTVSAQGRGYFWEQPLIEQPEVGLLAFATRMKDGIREFLVQAKFEPGTVNLLQLAPTVQATHSNYSQVHQGQKPPYMELFADLSGGRILYDSLQSEHGSRFLAKKNRNLIVEVEQEVAVKEEFRWMTLRDLQELAQLPNLLNMPARSVLAAMDYEVDSDVANPLSLYGRKILQSYLSDNSVEAVKDWVRSHRSRLVGGAHVVGLRDLRDWEIGESRIQPRPGSRAAETPSFSFGAVKVEAEIREVSRWSQPLAWCERGAWTSGLITQVRNGVLQCLVQNLFEPGLPEGSELGPTQSYRQPEPGIAAFQPMDFRYIFDQAGREDIRYDAVQSSEGGRFYHEENRLMILELDASVKLESRDRYRWLTLAQLRKLADEPGWLNIELRELMACFSLRGVPPP